MSELHSEKKTDHSTIISTYHDYNIIKESIFLPVCSFFSLFFIYQKINDRIMVKWQGTLYPLYLFFIIQFFKCFFNIIKPEKEEIEEEEEFNVSSQNKNSKLNVENIEKITLISNFFNLIDSALVIAAIYYFGEYLDKRKDNFLFVSIYISFSYCFSRVIYSLLRKMKTFAIKKNFNNSSGNDQENGSLAFFSSLVTPALTYFSNMMIICNSGVCTQVYMSTITSLLGAFGVSLSNLSEYLLPVTVVLLGISLFSLYIKKKSLTHGPFLLGLFSSALIILSYVFEKTKLYYLIYPGNILMIAAAIWNAKVNKFSGLPRFKK